MRVGPVDVFAPVVPIGAWRSDTDCAADVPSVVALAVSFLEQDVDKARATTKAVVVFIRMEIS